MNIMNHCDPGHLKDETEGAEGKANGWRSWVGVEKGVARGSEQTRKLHEGKPDPTWQNFKLICESKRTGAPIEIRRRFAGLDV